MAKTLKTRFRRRPKNLMDFFKVHGTPAEIAEKRARTIEELKRGTPTQEAQRRIALLQTANKFGKLPNPKKMLSKLRAIIGPNHLGQGCTFIFPLTSMEGAAEFIKGFCSEAAPKAKIVLLKTTSIRNNLAVEQLKTQLAGATRAIIIDDMAATGSTLLRIKNAIDGTGFSGTIFPEIEHRASGQPVRGGKWHSYPDSYVKDEHDLIGLGTDFHISYLRAYEGERAIWVKNRDKTLYMDSANALKYVQKHGKDISGKPKERLPENEFTQRYNKLRREVIFRRRQIYNLGVAYAKQALLNEKVETKRF